MAIPIEETFKNPASKSIEEIFTDFDGEYEAIEIDWGKPVGKEFVWDAHYVSAINTNQKLAQG